MADMVDDVYVCVGRAEGWRCRWEGQWKPVFREGNCLTQAMPVCLPSDRL